MGQDYMLTSSGHSDWQWDIIRWSLW